MTEMSPPQLTGALKTYAIERLEMDLVGIAGVERFSHAPAATGPLDYMPSARAVIVMAARIGDGIVETAGHYRDPGKTLGPYMWYGYPILNWDLSLAARRVVRLLEGKGFKALPFPPTGINYKFGNRADFSHRHAAVAAGLGELGLSGLFLSPQFGPKQRLVSIVTEAPLEATPMYDGPKVCNPTACGQACVRTCPGSAMSGSVSLEIDGRTFRHAKLDPAKCIISRFSEKGFNRTILPIPEQPTMEDARAATTSSNLHPFDAGLYQFTFVPHCGSCIFNCPAPRPSAT